VEERNVFLVIHHEKVALRRRPSKGLLAGLWEFPCELSSHTDILSNGFGFDADQLIFAGNGKHIFTHVEWHMKAYYLFTKQPKLPDGWVWVDKAALQQDYPVPNAYGGFLPLLDPYL